MLSFFSHLFSTARLGTFPHPTLEIDKLFLNQSKPKSSSERTNLPLEICLHIFSYLSLKDIAHTMYLSKVHNQQMPTCYLLAQPKQAKAVIGQWLATETLPKTWQKAIYSTADTISALCLSSLHIPFENKHILYSLFHLFRRAHKLDLAHYELKKNDFTFYFFTHVTNLALCFDVQYILSPWQQWNDQEGYWRKQKSLELGPHRLYLPIKTNSVEKFTWRYNSTLPACDYRSMPSLKSLKIKSIQLAPGPLLVPSTLTKLHIHLLSENCSQIKISALKLPLIKNLRKFTYHRLPLNLANLKELLKLKQECSDIEMHLSFMINFQPEGLQLEIAHACNRLAVSSLQTKTQSFTIYLEKSSEQTQDLWGTFFKNLSPSFCAKVVRLFISADITEDIIKFASQGAIHTLSLPTTPAAAVLLKELSHLNLLRSLWLKSAPNSQAAAEATINQALVYHSYLHTLIFENLSLCIGSNALRYLENLQMINCLPQEDFDPKSNQRLRCISVILSEKPTTEHLDRLKNFNPSTFKCTYEKSQAGVFFEKRWRRCNFISDCILDKMPFNDVYDEDL